MQFPFDTHALLRLLGALVRYPLALAHRHRRRRGLGRHRLAFVEIRLMQTLHSNKVPFSIVGFAADGVTEVAIPSDATLALSLLNLDGTPATAAGTVSDPAGSTTGYVFSSGEADVTVKLTVTITEAAGASYTATTEVIEFLATVVVPPITTTPMLASIGVRLGVPVPINPTPVS